jgi:outer membrane receptor protein involved in Fe transport
MRPIAAAVSRALHSKGRAPLVAATLLTSSAALAQGGAVLEEIVVTAQKRTENLQDVPIAVTAFDNNTMTQLGMQRLSDFILMVPNISFKSLGHPGSTTMYMRGAADGGDQNPSGSTPSVAVYLDEQPVTFIGGALDVHIYDMERIEALGGPQGTLYGAVSQTGTVRYITNKPDTEAFAAGFDVQAEGTQDGDPGGSAEGFVNFPIGTNGAIRLAGWYLEEGGWIDNVSSGAAGPNQSVANQYTTALTAGGTGVKTQEPGVIGDDFNEMTKAGLRAALRINLTDNWTMTLGAFYQKMELEGVWEHTGAALSADLPAVTGEREIQRYSPEFFDDEFIQYSLTVDGEIANHNLVYAGAFMDRDVDYETGYHAYGEYTTYTTYYGCDYTAAPPAINTDCTSGEEVNTNNNNWKRTSHELRLLSLADNRFHYTVGAFYEKVDFDYLLEWNQVGMASTLYVNGKQPVFFRTNQKREDTQFALFGEFTFDFTDSVSGTFGVRWFDEEAKLNGVVGWDVVAGQFTANPFDPAVPGSGRDTENFSNKKLTNSDTIFKANVAWNVTDDAMLYATWSEGYRPGGINREPALDAVGLQTWKPDIMTNYEIGWKTIWLDGRLRFNGAGYFMDWDDVQFTIYEFNLSACCANTYNIGTAEILGAEFDLTWQISDEWTASVAGAYNDAETKGDYFLIDPNDPLNPTLSVTDGTKLPNVPEFKGSATVRWDFDMTASLPAFLQLAWSYTDSSTSKIAPCVDDRRFFGDDGCFEQAAYNIGNFRAGVDTGSWAVDLFVDNLTDEVAEINVKPRNYEPTIVTNRPRTYGVRYRMRF